jgi:serine phosphatase RsbU (regulator of sigma subunit)
MFSRHAPRRRDDHSAATAIRTGRPITVFEISPGALDAAARDDDHRAALRRLAPQSLIVVPVAARGRVLGSLTLMYSTPGRRYDDQDVLVAQALADRAALAIENARLHTERTHIAHTLQHSLLPPSLPTVPGIEVAARYQAAGGENEVGGDFYDIYESEPGVFTLFVGDVAGKGAEAAAVTALARYTLRTASMLDSCPVRNLELLNDALLGRDASTCTAVYGRLRPEPGAAELILATAGHPPPLLLRAGAGLEELATQGIVLGAMEEPALEQRTVRLRPGDLVLLYTDGATDVRTPAGVLGDGPLRRELAACAGCTAEVVVERIANAIRAAQDDRLDDDLALLAVRLDPA